MMIRLENILCWKCKHSFDFSTEIPQDHVFSVYCGICESENVIDLNPYKKRVEASFMSSAGTDSTQTYETGNYDFPDQIPGQKPIAHNPAEE